MKLIYYPGCTLKNQAKNFEESGLCALTKLGVEVQELERWNCCGTVFSLVTDDLIHHLAPIRVLIRTKEAPADSVMTMCAMCFNTLKRANERVRADQEALSTLNDLMYEEETKYQGDVEIYHLLEILKDKIGFETIKQKATHPLQGLKVASYYGCYLVRPREIGIDDPENPQILDELMASLGATVIDFPYKTECCGAYKTVDNPEIVAERTYQILNSARELGAEVVVVSCPLCAFNLDTRQKEALKLFPEFQTIPILYFTQLLALALNCPEEKIRLDLNYIDPKPILKSKALI
ncbi:MAG: heterodisulfide reductase, subunit B [Candidatus Aminicenantes bacterium]|nr:MAG: heterodisulfide reductase, subunit B [Candidatus Aminicenantes bacterium]HDJ23639.1 heterodisulfide reductase, subunit B [Candidatus Aminicenantes bacterium]